MTLHIEAVAAKSGEAALSKAEPCMIVIFGATGDLTKRKLMPALCHLARKGELSEASVIIGVDREPMATENFRALMQSAVLEAKRDTNVRCQGLVSICAKTELLCLRSERFRQLCRTVGAYSGVAGHAAGAIVSKVDIVSVDIGTTTRVRLFVDHDGPESLPRRWFVKLPSLA